MTTFHTDRKYIENKYHNTEEPFNPYARMTYHGCNYDESTGKTDEEILQGLQALREELSTLPHPIAKARAVKYVLENTRIYVNEHDYFVGLYSVNRLANRVTVGVWSGEVKNISEKLRKTYDTMSDMRGSGAVDIFMDFDHVIPDWESILSLGFVGLKERANGCKESLEKEGKLTEEGRALFEGIDILYTAILALIDRTYAYAQTQTHAKAEKIVRCLRHLREGAPQDIYEAMQTCYLYFMLSECFDSYQVRSLGNGLDNSLFPFYEADLRTGRYTREEIKELLAYFLFQWSAIGNYWGQPLYLGGTNKDGSTRYNDLSRDILEIYDELGIYNPKVQLKLNTNTPEDILYKSLNMVRRNRGTFVYCCEPAMMQAVMSYGASLDEAYDMDIRGCYETGVRKNEVCTGTGYVNALKPVEYVFSNGYEPRLQKRFGLPTGELSTLKTFEDFYAAVLKQWEYLIELTVECSRDFEKYLSYVNPSLMYSSTIENSLKQGKDAYQNGVKFNNSSVLNCGMASLVDAVMAVKELVYEKKLTSLEGLKGALDADWVGYEDLRAAARHSSKKYGNGERETDEYALAMATFFADRVNGRRNARGGVYKAIMHSAMQFVWQGEKTPATPDGRKAGEEISKNASPSVGMDRQGVTALIRSACKLRPTNYPESFCLDVMLHPSAVRGEEGLVAMKGLLYTYMKEGGMSIQLNVFDSQTLRDAQLHPEKYENLQVRVCGWNVLWNHLSKKEQEAYIRRAEEIR